MRSVRLFIIGLLAASLSVSAASIVDRRGALHIQGTQLLDQAGNQIQLSGMSLFWSTYGDGTPYYTKETVDWLVKDWQISVIRIAMGITQKGTGYLAGSAAAAKQIALVDRVVQAAISNGIYVIIDWHEEQAAEHVDSAVSFFSQMAQKYGSTPNVIFEIWNEPNQKPSSTAMYSWTDIKAYAQKVIPAIRQYSQNVVVVGVPQWDQLFSLAAALPLSPTAYPNVAYTFHFYACSHNAVTGSFLGTFPTKLPIFVTEWGTSQADGGRDGLVCATSMPAQAGFTGSPTSEWFAKAIDKYKLSNVNWSVSNKDEASAILLPTTVALSGWDTLTDLSTSGKYVRSLIRRHCAEDTMVCPMLGSNVGIQKRSPRLANFTLVRSANQVQVVLSATEPNQSVELITADGQILQHKIPTSNRIDLALPPARQLLWVRVHGSRTITRPVPPGI